MNMAWWIAGTHRDTPDGATQSRVLRLRCGELLHACHHGGSIQGVCLCGRQCSIC